MTIPLSTLVSVTPGVIAAGGSNQNFSGLLLTGNSQAPNGVVLSFPNQPAVAAYFGPNSNESNYATYYFNGFDNSIQKPAALLIAFIVTGAPSSAYLRGGQTLSGTLAALQNITAGTLALVIDGISLSVSGINLSAVTSLSGAASTLQTALLAADPATATFNASITGTTMTVTGTVTNQIYDGMIIGGTNVASGTQIASLGTGTGGDGTYILNKSQTVASESMTASIAAPSVVYNSISNAFQINSGSSGALSTISFATGTVAVPMMFLSTQSGLTSQGASTSSVASAMNAIVAINSNFGGFTNGYATNSATLVSFAAWNNTQPYVYYMWDTESAPTVVPDTTSAGYQITQAGYSGTQFIYADPNSAMFAMGSAACLNFNQANGRQTLAYRSQAGLAPVVTNGTIAANLLANNYNFYGTYANSSNQFTFFQDGSISGPYLWWDSYICAQWLSNGCQVALTALLQSVGNVPYNQLGYSLIRGALYSGVSTQNNTTTNANTAAGPIAAAIRFGAIRSGVELSSTEQQTIINAVSGYVTNPASVLTTLYAQGWYLVVSDPGATVRQNRGSPICLLFYTDGQSVQMLNLSSTSVL